MNELRIFDKISWGSGSTWSCWWRCSCPRRRGPGVSEAPHGRCSSEDAPACPGPALCWLQCQAAAPGELSDPSHWCRHPPWLHRYSGSRQELKISIVLCTSTYNFTEYTYLLDIIYLLTSPCCHQASNAHTNLTLQAIVREEGNEASVDDDDPVHLEKCEEDSNKWSQNSIQIFVGLQNVINPLKNCLSICLSTLFR